MKKYEKEYVLYKEQEAQLEDPIERLQVLRERCLHTLAFFSSNLVRENFVSEVLIRVKLLYHCQ